MKNNYFESGQANAICDRCGFRFKTGELTKTWDGFWVCHEDFEPRHIGDFIKAPAAEKPLPFTRPEPADTFVGAPYISETIGVQENSTPPVTGSTNHGDLD